MKKIFLIVNLLFAFAGLTFAQAPKQDPAKAKPATTTHVKKDGTPDMRYKENKDAAKAKTVHLKKDGTPDKRFKENKTDATKKH